MEPARKCLKVTNISKNRNQPTHSVVSVCRVALNQGTQDRSEGKLPKIIDITFAGGWIINIHPKFSTKATFCFAHGFLFEI
jgi:hypothetical protein